MSNEEMIKVLREIAESGPLPMETHEMITNAILKLMGKS